MIIRHIIVGILIASCGATSAQQIQSSSTDPTIATGARTPISNADRFGAKMSVVDFGAKCDGATDDRAAIQSAINYVNAHGGGEVDLPRGTCVVSTATAESGSAWISSLTGTQTLASTTMLVGYSGVTLAGQGVGASVLKGTNGGLTILTFVSANGGGVRDLSVLGPSTSAGAGHGIFLAIFSIGDSNQNLAFQNIEVGDVGSYGIGAQQGNYSNNKYDKIYCHDVGADCIDHKVRNGSGPNTEGLSSGVSFSNIYCTRYGQRSGITNSTCMDIRGPATVTNVFAWNYGASGSTGANGNVGIRFSSGTYATNDTREPSKGSSISNFYISGDCTRTFDTAGIILLSSESTEVGNGYIECTNQGGVQLENSSTGYGFSQYASVHDVVVQAVDTGTAFVSYAGSTGASLSNIKSIGQDFSFSSKQGNLTPGQTVFSAPYNPSSVQVYKNGAILAGGGSDYTATDGITVTLTTGVLGTDLLDVITPNAGGFSINAANNSLVNATSLYTTTPLSVAAGVTSTFRASSNNFQQSGFTASESGSQPISTLWSSTTANLDYRIDALGTGGIEMRSRGARVLRAENNAASTVNWFSLNGSTTGNAVTLAAQGSDTNIDLLLSPKNGGVTRTSALNISGSISTAGSGGSGAQISTSSATITDGTASGTLPLFAVNTLSQSTMAAANPVTYTRATTLYIPGPPVAGTNVTSANGRSLYAGGFVELSGGLLVSSGAVNLNVGSNNPVNIGTGTSTSAVTLGGGSNVVAIGSHLQSTGTAPTVSGSGCSASSSPTPTDTRGVISASSSTSCTVTFASTYSTSPVCVATSSSATIPVSIGSISASAVTFNSASFTGSIFYMCMK